MENKSLIGLKYAPYDNSYAINMTSSSNYPHRNDQLFLAGTIDTKKVICDIVSDPFYCIIETPFGNKKRCEMIMVDYNNTTSCVIFHKNCVIDDRGLMENGLPKTWEDEI
jgi:hypothetical protein